MPIPHFFRKLLPQAEEKLARLAKVVFGGGTGADAVKGVEELIKDCGLAQKIRDLKTKEPVEKDALIKVADSAVLLKSGPAALNRDDVMAILEESW